MKKFFAVLMSAVFFCCFAFADQTCSPYLEFNPIIGVASSGSPNCVATIYPGKIMCGGVNGNCTRIALTIQIDRYDSITGKKSTHYEVKASGILKCGGECDINRRAGILTDASTLVYSHDFQADFFDGSVYDVSVGWTDFFDDTDPTDGPTIIYGSTSTICFQYVNGVFEYSD